jgi:hypothetical protein
MHAVSVRGAKTFSSVPPSLERRLRVLDSGRSLFFRRSPAHSSRLHIYFPARPKQCSFVRSDWHLLYDHGDWVLFLQGRISILKYNESCFDEVCSHPKPTPSTLDSPHIPSPTPGTILAHYVFNHSACIISSNRLRNLMKRTETMRAVRVKRMRKRMRCRAGRAGLGHWEW